MYLWVMVKKCTMHTDNKMLDQQHGFWYWKWLLAIPFGSISILKTICILFLVSLFYLFVFCSSDKSKVFSICMVNKIWPSAAFYIRIDVVQNIGLFVMKKSGLWRYKICYTSQIDFSFFLSFFINGSLASPCHTHAFYWKHSLTIAFTGKLCKSIVKMNSELLTPNSSIFVVVVVIVILQLIASSGKCQVHLIFEWCALCAC